MLTADALLTLTDVVAALHLIRRLAEGAEHDGRTLGMRRRLEHIADVARETLGRCKRMEENQHGQGSRPGA